MTPSIQRLQQKLTDLGYTPGPVDGVWGDNTADAAMQALATAAPYVPVKSGLLIPDNWLTQAKMTRVVLHWTAGAYTPNEVDLEHYHILIGGDSKLYHGKFPISANEHISSGQYAEHTGQLNTGAIGVSMCAMNGANRGNFDNGVYPLKPNQWATAIDVVSELCDFYGIPVTQRTVLTHAEVWPIFHVGRSDKWDVIRLPWDMKNQGAKIVGDAFRAAVEDRLK